MRVRITYMCRVCSKPIDDGKGYLSVNTTDAMNALQHADQEIRRKAIADGRIDPPQPVKLRTMGEIHDEVVASPRHPGWIPAHTACSATMSGPCYDIPVSQARSAEDLLKWSAQLLDKGWLYYTDWSDVLRDAAKGTVA